EESLKRELFRAKRKKTQLAVFMIDIDNFKDINDEFGHSTGDSILRLMSQCLTENIRQEDIACRYGGEEFTIILLESSAETAWNRAETLRKSIENLSHRYKKPIAKKITVSIGISLFPQHGQTAKSLINAADRALYLAKNQNRNQVVMSQKADEK
ncbi:MAG: GGDEF domain-containing protein, partial [Alphaproteobacteria bacterium]|nr:GGDEF domain-containing protein [Alphaproteobacteria bacterium]